jgi:hypothetical protein
MLHLECPSDSGQPQQSPTLREILPAEEFADVRTVREQALRLHRALPPGDTRVG